MKKFRIGLLAIFAMTALLFTSCNNDDDDNSLPKGEIYSHGVFVLNEGGFGAGNSSVSFIDGLSYIYHNVFETANGRSLGDVGQDIYFKDENGYIVMNGSNTVEVVKRFTFESIGTVSSGLSNPRYIVVSDNKAYVSNWGEGMDPDDDYIAVIDLNSYTVESTISVAEGPEKMLVKDNKVFVAHQGGWGYGNTVSVINTSNNTVEASIEVGDIPHSMAIHGNKLFVLSSGKAEWTGEESNGELTIIDAGSNSVTNRLEFAEGKHPTHLSLYDGYLYYTVDDEVYLANPGLNSLPGAPLFSTLDQGVFSAYGFTVSKGHIFISDAGDYVSNGMVYIYKTDGEFEMSYEAGLLPSGFEFNN